MTFADLHRQGIFVIPNPWDVASARLLEAAGFPALATTSSGFAATLGRADQQVGLDELLAHVASLTAAVSIPVAVDAENGYADSPAGVAETVRLVARAGAAGLSIEDHDPVAGEIYDIEAASERIAAAASAAKETGLVLTARAENHLYEAGDLDDTVARLTRYREAGADVLYAPGLTAPEDIRRVVAIGAPVNVLALPGVPPVAELAAAGVRRVSTGGALAWAAYGALMTAAEQLRAGTYGYLERALPAELRKQAFGG